MKTTFKLKIPKYISLEKTKCKVMFSFNYRKFILQICLVKHGSEKVWNTFEGMHSLL